MDKKKLKTYLTWINLPDQDPIEVLELLYNRGKTDGKMEAYEKVFPEVRFDRHDGSNTN